MGKSECGMWKYENQNFGFAKFRIPHSHFRIQISVTHNWLYVF
jgi:hypothetical protein